MCEFYRGQGKTLIPERQASRRFGKEMYRIAKALCAEGARRAARDCFAASFKLNPNIKSLIGWLRLTIKGNL